MLCNTPQYLRVIRPLVATVLRFRSSEIFFSLPVCCPTLNQVGALGPVPAETLVRVPALNRTHRVASGEPHPLTVPVFKNGA